MTLAGVKHYPRRPRGRVGDDGNEGRVRAESNRVENRGESVSCVTNYSFICAQNLGVNL